MEFKVRLFADGEHIEPSRYQQAVITSTEIDRIVNRIFDLANEGNDVTTEEAPSPCASSRRGCAG